MEIRNFLHKDLKKLYLEDSIKGVSPDAADKLRKMFAFLDSMEDSGELYALAACAGGMEGAYADW